MNARASYCVLQTQIQSVELGLICLTFIFFSKVEVPFFDQVEITLCLKLGGL